MFVGHALLAFAIAAGLATGLGWPRERAVAIGIAAAGFGMVPDVDIIYALAGLASGPNPESFWSTANVVHRTVTHSLVVGVATAATVGLWLTARREAGPRRALARAGAIGLIGGLVTVGALVTGGLAAIVMVVFGVAVLLVASGMARLGLGPRAGTGAALVGLLSHPFGDVFTGEPPAFLYPLDVPLLVERVALHPDPTLHLLGAFGVELTVAWLAVLVGLRITGRPLGGHLRVPAGLGVGYAAVAPLLPAPTLEVSYHFVYSVLAVGLLAALAAREWRLGGLRQWRLRRTEHVQHRRPGPSRFPRVAVTGLAAVTLAWLAYTAVYLSVGTPAPL